MRIFLVLTPDTLSYNDHVNNVVFLVITIFQK